MTAPDGPMFWVLDVPATVSLTSDLDSLLVKLTTAGA